MKIKSNKEVFLRHIAYLAVGILTVLSGFVLLPFRADTSNAATAYVASETTLTVDTEDIVVNAKTDVNNLNTFFTATSNLEIITNNYSGYTLRISAEQEQDHDKLLGENDAYLASIDQATTEADFREQSSFIGKFGYKPSKLNSDDNTNYLPAPDSTGDVLDVTSAANSTSNSYAVSLAARVDMSITSGEYSNVYVYTVVANPVPYMIQYDGNTTDTVNNLPDTQVDDTTDEDMTLSDNIPTREHYTFAGWCDGTTTAVDNADTCNGDVYQPGDSFYLDHTTNNSTTLKAMWNLNQYEVTVNAGNGVNTLALEGWTGTGTGVLKKTFFVGDTVDLSTFTPTYKTAYSGTKYIQNDSEGILNNTIYTVGDGDGDISISAAALDTPVCTMTGGAGKVYNRSATTLTATDNSGNYDTDSTDITYSFGYATTDTGTLGNFGTAGAGNTVTVAKNSHYSSRYYGVKVNVSDKNDNTITANCTSGTGSGTGTTVANRATVTLVNARLDFDGNNGTLSSTSPVYVAYQGTAYYTARTNASTATTLPTVTPPTGYTFAGWYTAATDGSKVVNADGTLTGTAVSGLTNASKQWVITSTSNTANTNTLYAHYDIKNNLSLKISFNSTYVSKVEVKSGSASGTTVGTVSTSGNTVTGLTYNTAYYLVPTYTTGSTLNSWAKDSGAVGTLSSTSAANPTYTIGDGTNAVTLNGKRQQYKVNLNKNGGTNDPTASVNATYYSTSLPSIATLPQRVYTMSGFTLDSTAANATITYPTAASSNCTASDNCKSAYTFSGWYKESGATTLVASNASTPALQASVSGLTDSSKRWIATSTQTLYAGWNAETGTGKAQVTLPTITKTGYTCKWSDGTNNYDSGAAIVPSSDLVLTGTCSVNSYTITVKAGNGIDTLTLSGWTNTGTGTLTKKLNYGSTLNLSTFTPAYKTAYSGKKYAKNSGSGSLSGSTFTVGAGVATLTINATTLENPVCTMRGGGTKVYNYQATTLTATDNSGNYDISVTDITYSFGWATNATNDLANFSAAQSGNTISIAKNGSLSQDGATVWSAYRNARHYGVTVVVTDKNDNTITATCTSGTGSSTGSTVNNRTSLTLVNARIDFDATTNGGTLNGTTPAYAHYGSTAVYSGRTNATAATIPSATKEGYDFAGWYTAATDGSKVVNADGTLTGTAVSGLTNASKQWIITSSSNTANTNTLYAHYDIKTNLSLKITFNSNHVSKVEVKSGSASGTTVGTVSISGSTVAGLTYGEAYYLVPTYKTGYKIGSWAKDSGAVGTLSSTSAANPTYTIGDGTNAVTLTATTKTYTITLNKNGATNTPTASVNVRYLGTSLASITTMPERVYNVSFTNNASATVTYSTAASSNCTSSNNCKSTYTFDGWYKEAAATNKIASSDTTPVLQANTDYTDANGKWSVDAGKTLYAGWAAETGTGKAQITLPTVTLTGHTCKWNTKADGTGTSYDSGASVTPSSNLSLYVVATANQYTITLNQNGASTEGTTSTKVTYGNNTLTPSITNPVAIYTLSGFSNYPSGASVSSTANITSERTFNGWTTGSASGGRVINADGTLRTGLANYTDENGNWIRASNLTLYARWGNGAQKALPTITKTGHTCIWTDQNSNTYDSGANVTPSSDMTFTGSCTANQYTVTLNKNGATNTPTSSVKVTYGATTLGAVATKPARVYTISGMAAPDANTTVTFQSSGNCKSASSCKSTYAFNGWYKESGATNLIASNDDTPALQASTSYTNASKQWTSTSNRTLYAGWTAQQVTLPTITRTGYTCKWYPNPDDTSTSYNSGAAITPTSNLTLTGICTANTYSLAIKFAGSGVSSAKVCKTSGNCSGTNLVGTVSTSGDIVSGLVYNTAYYLYPVFSTGYKFSAWAKTSGSGSLSATNTANPTFTVGAGSGTVTVTGTAKTYTVTLNPGSNCSGSTSTTATYAATTWAAITTPTCPDTTETRAVSGFTAGTNASGASISSTSTKRSTRTTTYSFNGWYTASSGGTKIASNASTPALQASTTYTNASKQWTYDGNATVYAQYSSSVGSWTSVKLPTITKAGFTCGWSTTSNAANYSWASGATITPSSAMTMYGICVDSTAPDIPNFNLNSFYMIKVNANEASYAIWTQSKDSSQEDVTVTAYKGTTTALKSATQSYNYSAVVITGVSGLSSKTDSYTLRLRAADPSGNTVWNTTYKPTISGKRLYIRQMYWIFRGDAIWVNYNSNFGVAESEIDTQLTRISSTYNNDMAAWTRAFLNSDTQEPANYINGLTNAEKCSRFYYGILGRSADQTEINNCANDLNNGTSWLDKARNMAASPEAQNIYSKWF